MEGDPHKEEFEADQFALRICYEVERYPLIFVNPYLASGAGGVILLTALQALREVETAFGPQRGGAADTHPEIQDTDMVEDGRRLRGKSALTR